MGAHLQRGDRVVYISPYIAIFHGEFLSYEGSLAVAQIDNTPEGPYSLPRERFQLESEYLLARDVDYDLGPIS